MVVLPDSVLFHKTIILIIILIIMIITFESIIIIIIIITITIIIFMMMITYNGRAFPAPSQQRDFYSAKAEALPLHVPLP